MNIYLFFNIVVLFLKLIFLKINNQRQMSNIYHPIFTNYYLTPDGNIMNSRDREAKQSLHNDKMVLTIRTNKKNPVKYPVDKFIYEAAVGRNISNYLDIIHINGDKLDNSLSNLKLVVNKSDNNPYKDRVNIIATNLDTDANLFTILFLPQEKTYKYKSQIYKSYSKRKKKS